MKQIELKKVPITILGDTSEFAYRDMLQVIVETPSDPQKGASIDEVRRAVRILDRLEVANGILELEDADFSHLLDKVRHAHFTSSNRVFVEFVDYFESLRNDTGTPQE